MVKFLIQEIFTTRLLGSAPANREVYQQYIASKKTEAEEKRRKHAERTGTPSIAPEESAFRDDTHWVAAGPTWEDALLRSSRVERSYPDVGFRCAVDAELAWTWLDQGRFRVKE